MIDMVGIRATAVSRTLLTFPATTRAAPRFLALLLVIAVGGCYDKEGFVTSPTRTQTYLDFTVVDQKTELPADGFSRATLRATIDAGADAARRTIVFSAAAGTLSGGSGAPTTQEVTANGEGVAEIELVSSTVVREARVRAEVKGVPELVRDVVLQFKPVDASSIIRFVSAPTEAPADGATKSAFRVLISSGLPKPSRTVRFTTSAGVFETSSAKTVDVDVDQSNETVVEIRSPSSNGSALVTATVNGFTAPVTIAFVPALPTQILVDAARQRVKGDGSEEVVVTAKLLRPLGVASAGTVIDFDPTTADAAQMSIGLLHGFPMSDGNGEVRMNYAPGATQYRGPVTITARLPGTSVAGVTTILITDP